MTPAAPGELAVKRPVPRGSALHVAVGETVGAATTLATLDVETGPLRRVESARHLGCRPEELGRYLVVRPLDLVSEGQSLAVRVCLETPRVAVSPVAGRVALVSSRLGFVYVREMPPVPAGPIVLDLHRELGLPRPECRRALRVKPGQRVIRGQVLAGWATGYASRYVTAPVSGTVSEIAVGAALLTLDPAPARLSVPALVPGRVTEVVPGSHVTIVTEGWRTQGVFGVGGPVAGRLVVDPGNGDGSTAGAVALLTSPPEAAELRRLEASGTSAVIAPFMDQWELVEYLGQEIRLGVTSGTERSGMAVVLLGGFDSPDGTPAAEERPAARQAVQDLEARAGGWAYVDGRTQIRAGARRPEVIVTQTGAPAAAAAGPRAVAAAVSIPSPPDSVRAAREARLARLRELIGFGGTAGAAAPPARWVYPCCRPRTAEAYLARFPWAPVPRAEAFPGEITRTAFPGLPFLEGPAAQRLGELADGVAPKVAAVLESVLGEARRRPPAEAAAALELGPAVLIGTAFLSALREEERPGLGERDPVGRDCPGFVLTSDSPATVVRAVPTGGGAWFLALLGRAYGWEPWHLGVLGRPDVSLVVDTLDDKGRLRKVSHGFVILKQLRLVRSFLDTATGTLAAPAVTPGILASLGDWLRAGAVRLARVMNPHWGRLAAIVARPEPAGGETSGRGDLLEAYYACLADSVLIEAGRRGLFPAPVRPEPAEAAVAGRRDPKPKVWLEVTHVPSGLPIESSNSWPVRETPKPLGAAREGGSQP